MGRKKSTKKTPSSYLVLFLIIVSLIGISYFLLSNQRNPNTSASASVNRPTQIPGYLFDGATGYIDANNSGGIQAGYGTTFEAWVKPNPPTPDYRNDGYILNKGTYSLLYQGEILDDQYRVVYTFAVADKGGSNNRCRTRRITSDVWFDETGEIPWTHVAGVIQDNGDMQMYINGEPSSFNSNNISSFCTSNQSLTVAAQKFSSGPGGLFPGEMDNLRISDIDRYPNPFTPPSSEFVNDLNTTLLYNFNTLDNNTAIDSSSNGHDGTVIGGVILFPLAPIQVEVEPKSRNISCKSTNGIMNLSFLTDSEFDATLIDISSLQMNSYGLEESHQTVHQTDADGDGDVDGLVHLEKEAICNATSENPLRESVAMTIDGANTDGDLFESTINITVMNR